MARGLGRARAVCGDLLQPYCRAGQTEDGGRAGERAMKAGPPNRPDCQRQEAVGDMAQEVR